MAVVKVDMFVNIAKNEITARGEGNWMTGYSSGRVGNLINQGYAPDTAKNMAYFEIGLKISLDLLNAGFLQVGFESAGGAIGATLGTIAEGGVPGPGTLLGEMGGSATGYFIGGAFCGWLDEQIAQKISEHVFSSADPMNQDIDLSKIPTYISNPMKGIQDFVLQAENTQPIRIDPLLVDLDGDGIETTTVGNGVYFDHDKNGFAQQSAWVTSDDGVLAFDKNADGVINDGGEIFGDNYVLSNGQKATTGFQALADLDSNLDGVIDSSDTNFSNIKVLKGDGNLLTLAEAGIASINLTNTTTSTTDANGNIQLRAGTYKKTDATTGVIGDYSLAQDAMYSISTDWVEVSAEIAA